MGTIITRFEVVLQNHSLEDYVGLPVFGVHFRDMSLEV